MARIYLDHNATTPLHPEVAAAMAPWLGAAFGNASSIHAEGRRAREAVETARRQVAALVDWPRAEDVVFTSGGTEADNLAILGLARALPPARRHLVTSALEHPAVLETARALARGPAPWAITEIAPSASGEITPEALAGELRDDTGLVALAGANHEIGARYPVAEYARLASARGALLVCDGVQAAGKVEALGTADLVTLSGHKLYGPQGVGALVGRGAAQALEAILHGGHQERGRRPGTEPVAAIVGLGAACALWRRQGREREEHVRSLRDRLECALLEIDGARLFGPADGARRVAGTLDVGFEDADGQLVVAGLDLAGVAASTGAACSSGTLEPSRVIRALGVEPAAARTAVRFSLGWGNTGEEIERVAGMLPAIVARVRAAR